MAGKRVISFFLSVANNDGSSLDFGLDSNLDAKSPTEYATTMTLTDFRSTELPFGGYLSAAELN